MKQDLKRSCFYGELLHLFKKIKKYRLYFALIFIGVFVSCLYYPVLNAQYVWDDTLLIVTKTGLRENPLSWELISSPVLPGTSYFRPLIFLSWYWEFKFFGQNIQEKAERSRIVGAKEIQDTCAFCQLGKRAETSIAGKLSYKEKTITI